VQGLASRVLARLEARHLACGELALILEQQGGARDARRIGAAAPTLDLRSLVRLVCHALESQPPRAAITGVRLDAEGRALQRDQLDLFRPAGPAPAALGRTLAELEALCGGDRIGSPRVADRHHPDAFEIAPFQPARAHAPQGADRAPARADGAPHSLAIRALRPPLDASVRVDHGRPEHVRSAIANGRVLRLAGPWRATGGWWSPEERFAYDSFDVQTDDGTVARLRFDHLRQRWQIDAVYD
jgi:protein ImuB